MRRPPAPARTGRPPRTPPATRPGRRPRALRAALAALTVAAVAAGVAGCGTTTSGPDGVPTKPAKVAFVVRSSGEPTLTRLAGPKGARDVDVMTFNVQDEAIEGAAKYVGSGRREAVAQVFADERPDVVGTQEMLPEQAAALLADLTRAGLPYAWYGRPRVSDEGGRPADYNETVAVFWDTSRFDEVGHGDAWICAPDEPAAQGCVDHGPGWTAGDPRMATWVRLREKASGRVLLFVNTHLDAGPAPAKEHGAQVVRDLVASLRRGDEPVVLTADFNGGTDAAPHALLTDAGFADAWSAAARTGPDVGTFNRNAKDAPQPGPRIDRVYVRTDVPAVVAAAVDTFRTEAGLLPSDHYPVLSRIRLSTGS